MKKLINKLTAILLTLSLVIANISYVFALDVPEVSQVNKEVTATAEYVLSALNSSELGIYNYKEVILIMQSGIKFGDLADNYINLLQSNISNGKLILDNTENITMYAAYLIVLALNGDNALDINENNMVAAFNNSFAAYETAEELNTALGNPYYYDFIVPAVFSYAEYMEDADTIKALLCDAIMLNYKNTDQGCGIDYWGLSCDNNAAVIPALNYFSDNSDIATAVEDAVAFNDSLITEDGSSMFDTVYTDTNANSTAAALYLYSTLDYENSALSYNGLMKFKSNNIEGAYTYYDSENMYATVDALKGLVAYQLNLNNEASLFDVSAKVIEINSPLPEDPTEETVNETTTKTKDTESITTDSIEDETVTINDQTSETTTVSNISTTTASNASTTTGDNAGTATVLLLICILSAGTIIIAGKKNDVNKYN